MSEKIKLADLIKEKEEATEVVNKEEVQTAQEQPEVRTEVTNTPPVDMRQAFNPSNLVSADLSDLPSGKVDPTKQARIEIEKEIDDGIQAAFERRFLPAMKEANKMYKEYQELVAMGEENPRVVSTYDASLDLDPNLSDAEVEAIRKAREEEKNTISDIDIENRTKNIVYGETSEEDDFMNLDDTVTAPHKEESSVVTTTESVKPELVEDKNIEEVQSVKEDKSLLESEDDDIEFDEFVDDLDIEEDDEDEEKERARQKRNMEEFSRVLKRQLDESGESKKVDISNFKIRKKAIPMSSVLSKPVERKHYEWGLFSTGISISMTPLSAIELDEINPYTSTSNNDISRARNLFSTIYRHLAPECRNMEMEVWLKSINFKDLNHLFFAMYNANFSNSNIIPFSCPKCKHFFTAKRPIIDMVNFGSDEAKEKFKAIIAKDPSMPTTIEEEVIVSGKYAFGIVTPNIYNSLFEERLLNESFREKYEGIINISHCISTIYEIDVESEELVPIQFKYDKDDIVKTYKYRIRDIYRILSKLSAFEFKDLQDSIAKHIERNSKETDISYQVPATTCPKCGSDIEAIPMNAQDLVFTRHRLIHMID